MVELESSDEGATNGHGASVGVSQLPSTSDGETGDTGMIEPPHKQFREQADELLYIDWLVQQKATEKKVAQRNPKLPQIQVDGLMGSLQGRPCCLLVQILPHNLDILLALSSSAAVEHTFHSWKSHYRQEESTHKKPWEGSLTKRNQEYYIDSM